MSAKPATLIERPRMGLVIIFLTSAIATGTAMVAIAHQLLQDGFPGGAAFFLTWGALQFAGVVATTKRLRE